MDGVCEAHPFAPNGGRCSACQRSCCAGCLVYADLDAVAPVCLPCALRARQDLRRRKHPTDVVDLRHR
jgi:hypothetical protein